MSHLAILGKKDLYHTDLAFSGFVDAKAAEDVANLAKKNLEGDSDKGWFVSVEKRGNAKTSAEVVSDFFSKASALDGFCKMMKQFAELMEELRPGEAVWERMGNFYGTARNATAPFYLLLTVNTVRSSFGKGIAKVTKAWADMISAICINWMAYSKLLFNRSAPLAGKVLAGTSFTADVLETREQFKKFSNASEKSSSAVTVFSERLQDEKRIALSKTVAMGVSATCGGFAIWALAFGAAPVPAAVLLTAALGSTVLKNAATFYEHTRDTDLRAPISFA